MINDRNDKINVKDLFLNENKIFFTSRRNFACDDIIFYEIIFFDDRIIVVDKNNNNNLFITLKNDFNNFNIITNFKMSCFYCD